MYVCMYVCKTADYFESHNSSKHTFTNIRGLLSNFVGCEFFLESNSPDIFVLWETNLEDSISNDTKEFIFCQKLGSRDF